VTKVAVRIPHPRACVVVGHKYPAKAQVVDDEAPSWRCQRCGHRRWTEPPDFWSGAGHLSGSI
jgi:hypothetical protein